MKRWGNGLWRGLILAVGNTDGETARNDKRRQHKIRHQLEYTNTKNDESLHGADLSLEPEAPNEVVVHQASRLQQLYRKGRANVVMLNCQIVHDSLPERGFGNLFLLRLDGRVAGYGFVMGFRGEPKDMVKELKRISYEMDRIPAARCNAANIGSRATLQKAGLFPCARLLSGDLAA